VGAPSGGMGYDPKMSITKWVPTGKHTKNYGKSPFFMGKSTINGDFP